MNSTDHKFFKPTSCISNATVVCLEARLLLSLKTYAYGVPPKCFCDYFQMSLTLASVCCKDFDNMIVALYKNEYLRLPTVDDVQSIIKLHKAKHKVDGHLGCLDCTHTYWKNYPVAWKDMMLDCTLHKLEKEAGVVPFTVSDQEFDKLFLLVDGIYPRYNRFVKSYKSPITVPQQRFAAWQEAVRKNIERAFGVLKGQWQVLTRPIQLHNQRDITFRASACFILHYMNVSERVMGDCRTRYKPCASIDQIVRTAYNVRQVVQQSDLREVQDKFKAIYEDPREGSTREDVRELVMQTRGNRRFRELCYLHEF